MLFSNDVPHLRVSIRRSFLPRGPKNPNMGGLGILCNIDEKFINNYLDNKIMYHDNKYNHLYIDPIYSMKVGVRTYKKNHRKDINEMYDRIESSNNRIKCIKTFGAVKERNKYVSMIKYNQIFFNISESISLSYLKKIPEYLELFKSIINKPEHVAYNKFVMINIDEWLSVMSKKNSKRFSFFDPINILYFAMKRHYDEFKKIGDINIFIMANNAILRINPQECNEKSLQIFKRELIRMNKKYSFLDSDDELLQGIADTDERLEEIKSKLKLTLNFTGDVEKPNGVDKLLDTKIEEVISKNPTIDAENVEAEINADIELLKNINTEIMATKIGKSTSSTKRDALLKERQLDIKIKGKSIRDLLDDVTEDIPINDVTDKVFTTNVNASKVKFNNFEKSYNEVYGKKDISNVLLSLNSDNKTIPVYVKDVKVADTSNELNLKETYTVTLEDANRVRHTLKFDMPIYIDDKFMYLGGNRKLINKQLFMKPVVKTAPDAVKITSNYNIIYLSRFGRKVSAKIERFLKVLSTNNYPELKIVRGNHKSQNSKHKSIIEYDVLSELFDTITIKDTKLDFNQSRVLEKVDTMGIKLKDNEMCIGFKGKEPIIVDSDTHKLGDTDIVGHILTLVSPKFVDDFDKTTVGKKYQYTRAKILAKNIPLIILMGYYEGLTTVMKKAKINYHFSDTRTRIDSNNEGIIQFADGYLVYDKYPYENSLLMNAFGDIPTKAYNFTDFDTREGYADIFDMKYGRRTLGNDLLTYYEFMLDEITKTELANLNYPTDIVGLMIFANRLLVDNSFTKEYNMDIYRVRSNEIVNTFLYKAVAHAYSQYRQTANNKNPIKISVPQDVVIKNILTAQTIEDYSILNPIVELEKSRAISPKGPSGLNLSRAYTQEKRSYDKSMLGVLAMSTSPDGNCGVVRQMTMEPNIVGPRGYILNKKDNLDELKDTNLFSPAELLSPLGVTRDDTIRTAMASKQSKHIVPIKKSSPVLISNGTEQTIQYNLSNDFVVVAKEDGKVIEYDEDAGIVIIQYKSGAKQAIDTNPTIVKNGAGGFYLSNQISCNLKQGQAFKKNDVLASDENFFTDEDLYGNRFNIGSLQKVACMSTYSTFEDSTFITDKISNDMMTKIIMPKELVLGKNANVDYIVKVGQHVDVGEELLRFEMSFEEDNMNKLLASIGDELKEEIKSLGKTTIKSKYSGVIKDIKVYSTVELEELSPSLRKIVSTYYKDKNRKKKIVNKHDNSDSMVKLGLLLNDSTGKIQSKDGKVKGHEVGEGVLIEIYIEFEDNVGIGDKIVNFTALKSVVGEFIEKGEEPYTEFRQDEEISTAIAPAAILARQTPSILLTMFGNKVLIELKRKLYEIYSGKEWKNEE